jgi:hypothetical protein
LRLSRDGRKNIDQHSGDNAGGGSLAAMIRFEASSFRAMGKRVSDKI